MKIEMTRFFPRCSFVYVVTSGHGTEGTEQTFQTCFLRNTDPFSSSLKLPGFTFLCLPANRATDSFSPALGTMIYESDSSQCTAGGGGRGVKREGGKSLSSNACRKTITKNRCRSWYLTFRSRGPVGAVARLGRRRRPSQWRSGRWRPRRLL